MMRRDAIPAPGTQPPKSSWWVGLDRAAFAEKQADEQPRMSGLDIHYNGHRPNLAAAVDGRIPPTSYPERLLGHGE